MISFQESINHPQVTNDMKKYKGVRMSQLVTILYGFILFASVGVITMFDLIIYNHSLQSIVYANLFFQRGTSQWMLYAGLLVGFIYSVVIDYRYRKSKKARSS